MRGRVRQSGAFRTAIAIVALAVMVWAARSATTAAQTGSTPPGSGASAKGGAAKSSAAGGAVARGKYLVDIAGCHDCHTPQKMGANGLEADMSRMLAGHPADRTLPPPPAPSGPWIVSSIDSNTAFAGPWGISYTRNLTPDQDTGLGAWTEQQFVETIRNGRHQGRGRQILPPMPWPVYRNMTDADLKAVFAYLKTIPAVSNKVPDPVIAAPPTK
jgi:mono/diheme cytochrome c family protein